MAAKISSIGLRGLEGYRVNVEVETMEGINSIKIVGLPDASVKESKERITAAFHSLGYIFSHKKIIINLSPSDQKKNGALYDLPIAIGILVSLKEVRIEVPDDTGFIGALSLDGSLQPVEGMLPVILAAKQNGVRKLYIPVDDLLPELEFENLELVMVSSLIDVVEDLLGRPILKHNRKKQNVSISQVNYPVFEQIIGHSSAKQALEIAAAGCHHVLMAGPPGSGKSLLAESFPSILPPLSKKDWFEVLSIYQLSGSKYEHGLYPPFRSPHHSASGVSIIGGGQVPRPGEISLAHRGVLFLDELAEFSKNTLEMLRQPLESGRVTISRVRSTLSYPSTFILLAAMNPCPCGYNGSRHHYCTCSKKQINTYKNKVSGPIKDRFDIFLTINPTNLSNGQITTLSTSETRERVKQARDTQYERYGREICNSRIPYEELLEKSPLTPTLEKYIQEQNHQYNWSNRTYIKILRIARTIADLQHQKSITNTHINTAIQLNSKKDL